MTTTSAPVVVAPELAGRIEAAHQAAQASAKSAIECGELLLEAKRSVGHGGFLPWLAEGTSLSARQAQKYMRVARHRDALANAPSGTYLSGAIALLAEPKREPSDDDTPAAQAAYVNEAWSKYGRGVIQTAAMVAAAHADLDADGWKKLLVLLAERGLGKDAVKKLLAVGRDERITAAASRDDFDSVRDVVEDFVEDFWAEMAA